jgi:hypothetical protein
MNSALPLPWFTAISYGSNTPTGESELRALATGDLERQEILSLCGFGSKPRRGRTLQR